MRAQEKVCSIDFTQNEKPKVKFYYKYELAELYGVHLNTLCSILKRHEEEFMKVGYNKNQKTLSPLQVQKLFDLIGEP